MTAILDRYAASGIENILCPGRRPAADLPDYDRSKDAFRYAEELVKFIRSRPNAPDRARLRHRRRRASPEGHPGTPNRAQGDGLPQGEGGRRGGLHLHATVLRQPRLLRLPRALRTGGDQGADRRRDHADHDARRAWCGWPSWPWGRATRPAAAGAVGRCGDDAAVGRVGVHWATEQCRDLLHNGVRGIHFYTLNRSDATRQIYENLGVTDSLGLAVSNPSSRSIMIASRPRARFVRFLALHPPHQPPPREHASNRRAGWWCASLPGRGGRLAILKKGGNAVDAAVAVAFAHGRDVAPKPATSAAAGS